MNKKLLLVDDDVKITTLLKELLELECFCVEVAHNAAEALAKSDNTLDLILLDIMMLDINELIVLKQLRIKHSIPIILLTAKDSKLDKIIGLELGADDYIVKPFNGHELIARIRALLKRKCLKVSIDGQNDAVSTEYNIDGLKVNIGQQAAYFDDKYIELTGTEFQILLKLLEQPGKIISRDTLSESVLGKEFLPFARSIDVHISNLRKKLPLRNAEIPWIKTRRSKGYLFIIDKEPE